MSYFSNLLDSCSFFCAGSQSYFVCAKTSNFCLHTDEICCSYTLCHSLFIKILHQDSSLINSRNNILLAQQCLFQCKPVVCIPLVTSPLTHFIYFYQFHLNDKFFCYNLSDVYCNTDRLLEPYFPWEKKKCHL